MKKSFLVVLLSLLFVIPVCAYDLHWVCDNSQFDDYMPVTCVVEIDDAEQTSNSLELAAFCGTECRGARLAVCFSPTHRYIFQLPVYGHVGDEISFKLFDHEQNVELENYKALDIAYKDEGYGTLLAPFVVEFKELGIAFKGTVDDKWSNASNWSTGALPQATDEVEVDSECVLDVNAEIFSLNIAENITLTVAAGNVLVVTDQFATESVAQLVLEDGAQLSYDNGGVLATVKKNIRGYVGNKDNYYLLASPVVGDNEVANLTANEFDLFAFDQSQDLEWRNMKQTNGYALGHGRGYLYANSHDVTLEFAGELGSGAVTTPLDYVAGAEFAGFNLVGNPYPCNAYINRNFLRMNADGTEFIPGTGAIGVSEAVFVEAAAAGETVTFTKEDPVARGLSVEVAKGASKDRAIISFAGQGLHKMMLNEDNTKVYVPQGNKRLAVAVAEDMSGEMPVNFKAAENGTYTISINAENVNADYLHLVDNMTGADVDLKSAPSYTFEARTTDYASRFRIIFSASNADDNNAESETFAYMINGNLVIDNAGEATLQIVDMLGRVVSTETFVGNYNKTLNVKAGLYVVRMNDKTQKIVVD